MYNKQTEKYGYLTISYNDTILKLNVHDAQLEVKGIVNGKLHCRLFVHAKTDELEDEYGFEQLYLGLGDDEFNYLTLNEGDLDKETLNITIDDEDESAGYVLMYTAIPV